MAKASGLGLTVNLDDSGGTARDISNDVTNCNWKTSSGVQDITGVDKSGMERLLLQADGQFVLNGVFNGSANRQHAVLKDYRTIFAGQVGRTLALAGVTGLTISMEVLVSDYAMTRAANGALTWQATASLCDGTVPTYT